MTRILVTGGGGFLGTHLVERLRADGLERPATGSELTWQPSLSLP